MPKTPKAELPSGHLFAQPFTVRDLQDLLGARTGPCVSIYEPAHARPDQSREDRLRWKNLLADARAKAESASHPRTARKLLAALETLDEGEFRHGDRGGIAAFAADQFVRVFRVPMELPERVVVADSFHVRPLLRWLQSEHRYYVLAISKNSVRFFEGVNGGLIVRDVPLLPTKMDDVVVKAPPREGVSARSLGRSGPVRGGSSEPRGEREDVSRYLRAVDHAVCAFLRDEHAPLVLVGVSRSVAAYRGVNHYAALAHAHVEGSFDRAGADELRERVEPIVAALNDAHQTAASDEFGALVGSYRATDELRLIAQAAVTGRVRKLLLARGQIVPGSLDGTTGAVTKKAPREQSLGDDLGDDLAEAVLLRGGQVLNLEAAHMPSTQPIAAIMRW